MKQTKELTVQEAALRMGVTMKYVRDLLYERKLPGAHKKGRIWRIPTEEFEHWRQAREGQKNGTVGVQH